MRKISREGNKRKLEQERKGEERHRVVVETSQVSGEMRKLGYRGREEEENGGRRKEEAKERKEMSWN